jgi:hypothetical protein
LRASGGGGGPPSSIKILRILLDGAEVKVRRPPSSALLLAAVVAFAVLPRIVFPLLVSRRSAAPILHSPLIDLLIVVVFAAVALVPLASTFANGPLLLPTATLFAKDFSLQSTTTDGSVSTFRLATAAASVPTAAGSAAALFPSPTAFCRRLWPLLYAFGQLLAWCGGRLSALTAPVPFGLLVLIDRLPNFLLHGGVSRLIRFFLS